LGTQLTAKLDAHLAAEGASPLVSASRKSLRPERRVFELSWPMRLRNGVFTMVAGEPLLSA